MYYYKEGWNTDIDTYEYWIMKEGSKEIVAVIINIEDAKKIVDGLNKQNPVRLNLRDSGICECPVCKTKYSYMEYCGGCGQKIDTNSVR